MILRKILFFKLDTIAKMTEWPVSRLDYSVDLLHLIDTTLSYDVDTRPFPDQLISHHYFTVDATKVQKVRDAIPSLIGLNLACIKTDKNGQEDYSNLCFDSRDRSSFSDFYLAVKTTVLNQFDMKESN